MEKVYNKFIEFLNKGLDWATTGRAMLVALCVLGAVLLVEFVFLVIAKIVARKRCCSKVTRWNVGRRRLVYFIAWTAAAFIYLSLLELYLPVALILCVFLIDIIISMFTGCRCCCTDCVVVYEDEEEYGEQDLEETRKIKEKKIKEPKAKKERRNKHEIEDEEKYEDVIVNNSVGVIEKPRVEFVQIENGNVVTERNLEEQRLIMEQRIASQRAAIEQKAMEERMAELRIIKERQAIDRHRVQEVRPVTQPVAPRVHAQEKARIDFNDIAAQKKSERLEELAEKIERQRQAAARQADRIDDRSTSDYSTERSRNAMNSAEETANKMDELQRRMEALRKTVTTKDVNTTVTVDKNETISRSSTINGKTTTDLHREKDRLAYQYDTLQNRLTQIENDKRAVDEHIENGVVTSRIQSRNKFDENEVRAALFGLKGAMEDVQKKIDNGEGR